MNLISPEESEWVNENLAALLNYCNEYESNLSVFKPNFRSLFNDDILDYVLMQSLIESLGLSEYEVEVVYVDDLMSLVNYDIVTDNVFDADFEIIEKRIVIEIPKSHIPFKEVLDFTIILNLCSAKLDVENLEYRSGIDDGAFRLLSVVAFGFGSQLLLCSNKEFQISTYNYVRGLVLELSVSNNVLDYAYIYYVDYFKLKLSDTLDLFPLNIRQRLTSVGDW